MAGWIMTGVQQIFYLIEIAISPIFIGLIVVPAFVGIASRFFSSLIAICLWPLGWAISDLVTKALIDLAVNPANNPAAGGPGGTVLLLGYWVVLAIWVIGSSLLAPVIIGVALIGGSSGIAALLGGTLDGAALSASRVAYRSITTAATATSNGSASGAPNPSASMQPYRNFARRPTETTET
jgi:hypothetical protein